VAHGASRFTKDIDFLVDEAPENIARVKQGLSILADNAAAEVADTDVRDHTVVRVVDEVIVDLMGRACGLTYADAAADMGWHDLAGVRVPVASAAPRKSGDNRASSAPLRASLRRRATSRNRLCSPECKTRQAAPLLELLAEDSRPNVLCG
jgi:hypothetical protein